ncbi:TonB-dependent receptor plug domain-containing protein [Pseudoduganella sp.]|uniref:TonB-dependent receptor plug domain-containing protein n=1 Tax=Pseudoduganella sp. TaxID=1880898 RepID=UPI0035AF3404
MKTMTLLLLGASTAFAAEPAPPQVEIRASALALRRDDTAGKLVLGREEVLRFGDGSLGASLQRLPGLSMNGSEVRMRGLGAGYTQVLLNGDPAPPGFAIDTLSPEMVERIEIMRSPGADSSAQAIAGSINIVLRRVPQRAQRNFKGAVERRQGAANPSAVLQWDSRGAELAYGLAATAEHSKRVDHLHIEDHSSAAVRLFDASLPATATRATLAPRLGWTPRPGTSLSWSALYEDSRMDSTGSQHETTLAGPSTRSPLAFTSYAARSHSLRSELGWSSPVGEAGRLALKAGYSANTRDSDYLFRGFDRALAPQLVRSVAAAATDRTASSSGKYTAPLGEHHRIAVGWDAAALRRAESRLQQDAAPHAFLLDQAYTAQVRRLALYAQDEFEPGTELQAYFGLRWEGWRTDVAARGAAGSGQHSAVWSPVLQGLWKLPGQRQVRLALSRTYKAPPPRDLVPRRYTINNDNNAANPDVEGNPALQPELAWGLDSSFEAALAGDGTFSVTGYARRIDNVTLNRLFEDGGAWVASPFNAGRAATWGLEFDLRRPLGPSLDLRASLGRNWSRVDALPRPANRLASQAPLTANLAFDWRAGAAWSSGLSFNYQGGARARSSALVLGERAPTRQLDVYLLWKPGGGAQWRLAIANALAGETRRIDHYGAGGRRSSSESTARALRLQLELPI